MESVELKALKLIIAEHKINFHKSQYEIANNIGISENRLSRLLNGKLYPSPDEIDKIKNYFEKPAEMLFPELLAYKE